MFQNPKAMLRPWLRRSAKVLAIVIVFVAAACGSLRWYGHYRYPYGPSHCCITVLGGALLNYADAHEGLFPHGEATPEASLSLLASQELDFKNEPKSAVEILRGKTVPADQVQMRLAAGKLLNPQTCGWHYVEGLTTNDDPRLAIVWDKIGLGHNGERLSDGGHEVLFVDGHRQMVSAKDWPEFLDRQKKLLAARSASSERTPPADE